MLRRRWATAALPLALAAACSVTTDGALCRDGSDCPSGQACSGEGRCAVIQPCPPCPLGQVCPAGSGACRPPYAVALTAPADGALVGSAGVAVTARLTLASSDATLVPVPAQLTLLAAGEAVAPLAPVAQDGLTVTYGGTWRPAGGLDAAVALAVQAGEGATLVTSPAVSVHVDTQKPALSSVTVACSASPCQRDGTLDVRAVATDARLQAVTVALDLGGPEVPLAAGPDGWSAQLRLRDYPFPFFRHAVGVTVTATDSAGNAATAAAPPVAVTRLRWSTLVAPGAPSLGPPAVDASGALLAVGADRALYRIDGATGAASSVPVPGTFDGALQPAVAGARATWVASDDGLVSGVRADGSVEASCPSPAYAHKLFAPALTDFAADLPYAAGYLRVYRASASACLASSVAEPVTAVPVASGAYLHAATSSTVATVRRWKIDPVDGVLTQDPAWTPTLVDGSSPAVPCDVIEVPLAMDGNGWILAACRNRQLHAVHFQTQSARWLASLAAAPGTSPVVLAENDLVVGTDDGFVVRVPGAGGAPAWRTDLGAPPSGLAVTAADVSGASLIVATRAGTLHALGAGGQEIWAARGADALSTVALRGPAVVAPAAPGSALPTLYVTTADGRFHAVAVDAPLDPASPWPKAHHDLRNSGNAGWPVP